MLETSASHHAVHKPRILAIANQKGGVGKTTTAVNLAAALAASGVAVLLIDFDPQGNASTGLGIAARDRGRGSYQLVDDGSPGDLATYRTKYSNLWLIPSGPDLVGAEVELAGGDRREYRLRDALSPWRRAAPFRYILIDCPPSLGLLTLNALVAADGVLVPLQCEFYALEGISGLTRTIEMVRRRLNPGLRLAGVVLTMYDRRNNLSDLVAEDARGFFGDWVYETVIPRNVRLSEAPSHGVPVSEYDAKSAGAQAYAQLAEELLRRDGANSSGPMAADPGPDGSNSVALTPGERGPHGQTTVGTNASGSNPQGSNPQGSNPQGPNPGGPSAGRQNSSGPNPLIELSNGHEAR